MWGTQAPRFEEWIKKNCGEGFAALSAVIFVASPLIRDEAAIEWGTAIRR
jgi:hypothetical protein